MSELKALLFDVDGTLADTEQGHLRAFNQAFRNASLPWQWSLEDYSDLLAVTGGKERIRHFIETRKPEFDRPDDLWEYIKGLHADKTRSYVELMGSGEIGLRVGVERLFHEARQAGLRLAIATTTTPENVDALLSNTLGSEALDWFEVIGAGSVVAKKKPAPDIYDYVMQQLGLRADECIAFEDSGPGVKSAVDAGLKVIVTPSYFTTEHDFSAGTAVFNQFGDADTPFEVLRSPVNGQSYLDIAMIRAIHAEA